MKCQECLSRMGAESVSDLEHDDMLRAHSATCEDCSRVLTMVVDGERDFARALDGFSSSLPAAQTAEAAIATARRRRVGRRMGLVLAILTAATLWFTWIRVVVPTARATAELAATNQVTETIRLSCLSSEQAGNLISPYVRSNGSAYYYATPPVRAITVRSTPEELVKVKEILGNFDTPAGVTCGLPGGR